jgi:hypothetical protein
MRRLQQMSTTMKSRFDRWTGARMNGPSAGTCCSPSARTRKNVLPSTIPRPRNTQ